MKISVITPTTQVIGWNNPADAGISRTAINTIAFGNGTFGDITAIMKGGTLALNGATIGANSFASVGTFNIIGTGIIRPAAANVTPMLEFNSSDDSSSIAIQVKRTSNILFSVSSVDGTVTSSNYTNTGTAAGADFGDATHIFRYLFITNIQLPGATTAVFNTTATITSGAGAQVGTLTNAPAAGNPTTWIKIIDNGVTRYIPAW